MIKEDRPGREMLLTELPAIKNLPSHRMLIHRGKSE